MTEAIWSPLEATDYDGPDKVVHFTEYLEQKKDSLSKLKIFKSEFTAFDNAMGGLACGEVIVLTGHRKEGKTTFAESWIRSMASVDASAKATIFSYEMPPAQLLEKWKGDPNMPLYLPMTLESNFEWIQKKCIEAKYKYHSRIILIDHIGFVVDMSTSKNYSMNVGAFMRRLKLEIALKHELAVLLVAHQSMPREDKEPSVDTVYGSVAIGQDSDATVVVMRRENLNGAELREFIAKAGEHKLHLVTPPALADADDNCSSKLAIVKVDCHRRTGYRKWKKMFRKNGDWLEEI